MANNSILDAWEPAPQWAKDAKAADAALNGFDYDQPGLGGRRQVTSAAGTSTITADGFGKKHEGETVSPAVAARVR